MKRDGQTLTMTLKIVFIVIMALVLPWEVMAQEAIQVTDRSWDANFREHITFHLSAESSAEIVEVNLLYRIKGQLATSRNEVEFTPGTSVTTEFVIDQTKPDNYQPPGTELEYWWSITDVAGNELKTERETLLYLDNRYPWQTLQNERLTLYWYEGDDSFGQALYERANEALDTLESDIGIALEDPIKIFIYATHEDLLGAIRAGAMEWTGGQAFATYGVVVIGIHPAQLSWGLNAMTHEMSHLVIHQATDNPFSGLPHWLDEGIAVYNENRDELDEDFRGTFEQAVKNNRLMTLRTLSSPFPADPLRANLAYGQSGAVVKFMVDTYGTEVMAKLLDIFSEGALYDEALQEALGVDTDGLDNAFRASLGLSPLPGTEAAAETEAEADAPEESEIAVAEEKNPEEASAAEAEAVEPVSTPVEKAEPIAPTEPEPAPTVQQQPAPQAAEDSNSPLSSLPCLTGVLVLMMMGSIIIYGLRLSSNF
jgi:hypothetical protein